MIQVLDDKKLAIFLDYCMLAMITYLAYYGLKSSLMYSNLAYGRFDYNMEDIPNALINIDISHALSFIGCISSILILTMCVRFFHKQRVKMSMEHIEV